MITPITLTNHVAKFESIPQILFELLHYKRWCVFFRTPDIHFAKVMKEIELMFDISFFSTNKLMNDTKLHENVICGPG